MASHRRPFRLAGLRQPSQVHRAVLNNGLVLVVCERPQLQQGYVEMYFGVGSRHENPRSNGSTHFLEHLLFRGTKSYRDATALNAAAENFGGFLEGATYRDQMLVATGCHPSAIGDAVEILGELVQSPRYHNFDVEKSILKEELLESLDADGKMIDLDNITHQQAFGSHGLALPIEGNLDFLKRVTIEDLEAHRREFLVAANAVLSIAGPFTHATIKKLVQKVFGKLPTGQSPLTAVPPPAAAKPVCRYVRQSISQVDLRLSFRGVSVSDPDYPALVMLARVLADGLSSRMHAELVDRRGLAYSLHAGLTTYADCGLFDFEVSVAPDKAAEAVRALLSFAHSSSRFRFSSDELERSCRRYRYSLEFMNDSATDLASWYGRGALFGVETQLEQLERRIRKITDEQLRHVARRVFVRSGLVLSAVGELARGEWKKVKNMVGRWT